MPTQAELEAAILLLDAAVDSADHMEGDRQDVTEGIDGLGATEAETDAAGLYEPVAELRSDLEFAAEEARLQVNVITAAPNFGSDPALYQGVEPVFVSERLAITGQLLTASAPGAAPSPGGGFLMPVLEQQVANLREGVRIFGPIMSRHLDIDGGAETGEWMYVECNARGGGCIDRIILTEPGGITVRNVLVTSDGYGRGMQTSMFMQSVWKVMSVLSVTRGATTLITFTAAHGLTPGRTMGVSIKLIGAPDGVMPSLLGYYLATVIDPTSITIPVNSSPPAGSSYLAPNMKVGLVRHHNPTQAGGVYAGTSGAEGPDSWNVPYPYAHASVCKSITYTVLKELEGRACSAVITIVTVPVDFDADGSISRGASDPESSNHGGSRESPGLWSGIEVETKLFVNPIVAGAANGFPGAMRFEVEWRFPLGMEGLAWYDHSYWRSDSNGGFDCPNTHFCGHVVGERTFQQKWLWRGGNNTNIPLTGRPFATDAGDKGSWDSDGPYGFYVGAETQGVSKGEDIGDGYQFYAASAAERAAVLPDAQTLGIIGIVNERNTTHKFAYASTVKLFSTAFPPGRSSTITYSRDAGGGTVGPEGQYIEGVASGGEPKNFARNYQSRYRSRFKAGTTLKNWHYMAFALNGAELMTSWNGAAKGKLGLLLDAVGGEAF